MVCETLINKKLMYRLYAANRLTKICVLLLLILVKQMLDMASIEFFILSHRIEHLGNRGDCGVFR